MRSRKDLPGSCVISTTMRSESTRVPPVTALRSPPDSRITGADSPVIADSSTEAMPSITVPSPGISSPASTTTTSPARELRGRLLAAVAQARDGLGAHRAQRGGLGLAAALGERLGQVREHDGQPQPDRHGEGEPGRLVAAAERGAAEDLDQPGDRGDDRADLDHEHDRVADLDPRVELGESWRRSAPAAGSSRSNSERLGLASVMRGAFLVEGQVQLEHVHAGLAQEAERAAVRVVRRSARSPARGREPHRAPRPRLDARVGLRDVRVDPGGRGRDGVDRHAGRVKSRARGSLAVQIGLEVLAEQVAQLLLVRAQVVEEGAGRVVARGRRARLEVARVRASSTGLPSLSCFGLPSGPSTGFWKSCPIRREPTTLPPRSTWLPSALFGNSTCETPVVASG